MQDLEYKRFNGFKSGLFTGLVETWEDIKNYKGMYQVSSFGRVKSLSRYKFGKNESLILLSEKIMTPKINKSGYLTLGLRKDGSKKFFMIHRLVADCFVKNKDNKPTVNHKDAVKLNNKVTNLEWATSKEQMGHALSMNLIQLRGNRKFSDKKRKELLAFNKLNPDVSILELSKSFCMSQRTVSRILKNQVTYSKDSKDIILLREQGLTLREIGEIHGLGTSQVWRICKRLSRKETDD